MNSGKCLRIRGNQPINGVIKVSGSKNASLPLIAASLLIDGEVTLENVPEINDIFNMLELLEHLNVKFTFKDNVLTIDSKEMKKRDLNIPLFSTFRASYYLIPILLKEHDVLIFRNVGGCNFENRPIDIHLDLFSQVGCDIFYSYEDIVLISHEFDGLNYTFNVPSVGATINAILLGVKTCKETTLINYSKEPEVECLIEFLSNAGIEFIKDDNKLSFTRKTALNPISFNVIPDRIEGETFALLGLALGKIGIIDFEEKHHQGLIKFLNSNYISFNLDQSFLLITKEITKEINDVVLDCFPELSTDIGPIILMYLMLGKKMFLMEDKIYKNRLQSLSFFTNCFSKTGEKLLVNPLNQETKNRIFYGTNLRETMAYLYYCLTHDGDFYLYGLEHLYRGYENIVDKLISLGCKLEVIDED